MNQLATLYSSSNIYFENIGNDEIKNDYYMSDFDAANTNKYDNLTNTNKVSNAINIYLLDNSSIFNGGRANYIPGNAIVIGGTYLGQNLIPSPVIAHEMGHCLGLYHPFETAMGNELVNGTNCSSAGDLVCDTPAESPSYRFREDANCQYTVSFQDSNGQTYHPDTRNIMDYMRPNCLEHFTPGQVSRATATIATSSTLTPFVSTSSSAFVSGADAFCGSFTNYTVSNAPAGLVFTWSSSNSSVATINASTGQAAFLANGTVTFTATTNSKCGPITINKSISLGPPSTPSFTYSESLSPCYGKDRTGNFATSNAQPGVDYTWEIIDLANNSLALNGRGSKFYFNSASLYPGSFRVTMRASSSCGNASASRPLTIRDCGGGGLYTITVYPNPAAERTTVEITEDTPEVIQSNEFDVTLYDQYGKKVKENRKQNKKSELDVRNIPNGLYYLRIGDDKKSSYKQLQIVH